MFAVAVHGQQLDEKEQRITYDEAQALEFFLVKELKKSNFVNLENTIDPSEVPLLTETRDKLMKFVGYVAELLKTYGCDIKDKPNERVIEKAYTGYKNRFNRTDPPTASSSQSQTLSDISKQLPDKDFPKEESGNSTKVESRKPKRTRGTPKFSSVTLAELIGAGRINVGTKLVSRHKRYPCEAEIADRQGNIQVLRYGKDDQGNWLHDLSENPDFSFPTPSGATSIIVIFGDANSDANGWTFWMLKSQPTKSLKDIRTEHEMSSQ